MKRNGNLFAQVFSEENLYQAYLDARRGKRHKRACHQFEKSLGANLESLGERLRDGSYCPGPYFQFVVHEPKERIIHAPSFKDCVVQHAIYREIYPIFNRTFIDTSFACRVGMGTRKASEYTQQALQAHDGDSYTLKLDVRKFFYRIDRTILRRLIERKIKDAALVEVMMMFAADDGPVGIPIGNLLSQIYALIYLNPVDHFIKRQLKTGHYVRYVDDMLLVGLTRQQCLDHREAIIAFLADNLNLELSKSTIQKVKRGVNFVGYRTWRSCKFIRKHSLYKFRKAVKAGDTPAVISLLGHARHTNSLQRLLTTAKEIDHALYCTLPESHRRIHHPQAQ